MPIAVPIGIRQNNTAYTVVIDDAVARIIDDKREIEKPNSRELRTPKLSFNQNIIRTQNVIHAPQIPYTCTSSYIQSPKFFI